MAEASTTGYTRAEVARQAILDAAAALFAEHGADDVSLREVAAAAGVQLSMIDRYVGSRETLVRAVLEDLTVKLAQEVVDRPLLQVSFERQSTMGRWLVMLTHFAVTRREVGGAPVFNPVVALAQVIEQEYGLDPVAARFRGAQIVASALGWRLFEDYLLLSGDLTGLPLESLHDEVTETHRRIGSTPWDAPRRSPSG